MIILGYMLYRHAPSYKKKTFLSWIFNTLTSGGALDNEDNWYYVYETLGATYLYSGIYAVVTGMVPVIAYIRGEDADKYLRFMTAAMIIVLVFSPFVVSVMLMSKTKDSSRNAYVTIGIILLTTVIFILDAVVLNQNHGTGWWKYFLFGRGTPSIVWEFLRYKSLDVMNGQIWRVFTCVFISKGFIMLVAENVVVYMTAGVLEKKMSGYRFFVAYMMLTALTVISEHVMLCSYYRTFEYDIQMSGMTIGAFTLIGFMFTGIFAGTLDIKILPARMAYIIVYIIANEVAAMAVGYGRFQCEFALLFGIVAGLVMNGRIKKTEVGREKYRNIYLSVVFAVLEIIVFTANIFLTYNSRVHFDIDSVKFQEVFELIVIGDGGKGVVSSKLLLDADKVFARNEIWRFVTSLFVERNIMSLWISVLGLCIIGVTFEKIYGSLRFIAAALTAGIVTGAVNVAEYHALKGFGGMSVCLYAVCMIMLLMGLSRRCSVKISKSDALIIAIYMIAAGTVLINGKVCLNNITSSLIGAGMAAVMMYAPLIKKQLD